MSNKITTAATTDIQVKEAVNEYLKNVQTRTGVKPSQGDVNNFINICLANKLNPFKRQAHLVGYDSKNGATFTAIVGIDGFRAIASRTGEFLGGKVTELTMKNERIPDSCTYVVKRLVHGHVAEFEATAYYDEAVQTDYQGNPNAVWKKQPRLMLQKVSESLALRKAFPDDIGGLYTEDEISVPTEENKTLPTDPQATELTRLIDEYVQLSAMTHEEVKTSLREQFGRGDTKESISLAIDFLYQAITAKEEQLEAEEEKKSKKKE